MPPIDPLRNVSVVLCDTSHPGNIGAAARAMKTMGLADLRLVRPKCFPDPQALWRAARAADVLEQASVHDTLDAALADVGFSAACSARTREIAVPALVCRDAAVRLIDVARTQRVALVFGNETSGLTTEDVNRCKLLAWIPANPAYSSLNVAAAVQVFAYELRVSAAAEPVRAATTRFASHEEIEGFYAHLEAAMCETGFMNPEMPKKLMPRLRRLFARSGLEPEEVNILRGILKSLSRKKGGSVKRET
jgi:tRNA/rRNA methyltransferase